ncbi:MAG: hypothetical protein GY820_18095 [Gammaproteobacteria bacterium]|nr:hypothetical protein [Gammaproteobacteria bacterium]
MNGCATKGYILSDQGSLFGHVEVVGFGLPQFNIKEIGRDLANRLIVENHYSGKFYNATYIHLGVFQENKLKGVLQLGYAMNPASQESVVKNTGIKDYLELNRMWLHDDCPKNSESMAISFAIKYIKKKHPNIRWIQSFADERCGKNGIVYQAANFGYYGEHSATFWTLDNQVYHNSLMTRNPKLSKSAAVLQENKDRATSQSLRQFRYLYFIHRNAAHDCLLKKQDYPKHYNEA